MEPNFWIAILLAIIGACFGSFVSLVSYRLPRDEDIIRKPSRCPSCETRLGVKALVPIISWIWSGGKCYYCRIRISIRYPLIELTLAALFVGIYILNGITVASVMLMLFTVCLVTLIVTDLEFGIIPDELHWAMLPTAIVYRRATDASWGEIFFGAFMGAVVGIGLRVGYKILRGREGLGMGDVKFLIIAGLWIGVMPMLPFLFYAGLIGTLTAILWRLLGRGEVFPFGPALAISLFLCVLFPQITAVFWNPAPLLR